MRVADEIRGYERLVGDVEHAIEARFFGGGLEGGIDLLDGDIFGSHEGEVAQRDHGCGYADAEAVELTLKSWESLGGGSGGAGSGGYDVLGGVAALTNVLGGRILERLAGGVAVNGGHHGLLDAEVLLDHNGYRSDAVGGAGGVRHDGVGGREVALINPDHECPDALAFAWTGDNYALGTCLDVLAGVFELGETTGGLDDDIDSHVFPG